MHVTGADGILQIHPTRRCNLTCVHCYSDSGPTATDELGIDLLRGVLIDAADLGYTVLSVSGGEPLMYRPLPELLAEAQRLGLRTLVTTNGTMTGERMLASLAGHLDLLALSLDGPPAEHDVMRARQGAFRAMSRRLEAIRASGIRHGFLFTLTQHNVHHLEWAVEFAIEQGASLLQIHPLEAIGRGAGLGPSVPDLYECSVAVLEVGRLRREVGDRLTIQLDLAVRTVMMAGARSGHETDAAPLAGVLSPLVVEPDGRCVPLSYGFPDAYALGNVRARPLRDLAASWRRDVEPRFVELGRRLQARIADPRTPPVFNWYEMVASQVRYGCAQ